MQNVCQLIQAVQCSVRNILSRNLPCDRRLSCRISSLRSLRLRDGFLPYYNYGTMELPLLTVLELTKISGGMEWLLDLFVPRLACLKLEDCDSRGYHELLVCTQRPPASFPLLR